MAFHRQFPGMYSAIQFNKNNYFHSFFLAYGSIVTDHRPCLILSAECLRHFIMDATDDTLRQQFQALQEQQQKKLLRRKQRQEEKNKKELVAKEREENGKKTKDGSEPGGLRLNDDLELKVRDST